MKEKTEMLRKFLSRQFRFGSATLTCLRNHISTGKSIEKRKRWQHLLILGVLFLTVYNILPTVFFYSKQLKNPVTKEDSTKISSEIMQRVNRLEDEATSWLGSFCKSLHLKPQAIILDSEPLSMSRSHSKTPKRPPPLEKPCQEPDP